MILSVVFKFIQIYLLIILVLITGPPTPPLVWPLSNDCPDNYEHGKFMLTLGQLVEEPWEVWRIHLWYMHVVKLGVKDIIVGPQGVLLLGRRLSFNPWLSMTCIGCCGARTSTSHKSPFLPYELLHLCIAEGTLIMIKLTMPWPLVLIGCNHMQARNWGKMLSTYFLCTLPKGQSLGTMYRTRTQIWWIWMWRNDSKSGLECEVRSCTEKDSTSYKLWRRSRGMARSLPCTNSGKLKRYLQ